MASPHPKPRVLAALHGNPSHANAIPDDPVPGHGLLGLPPTWFDLEQLEQWHSVLERAPLGLLTETDREIVIAFVVSSVEYQRAVEEVRRTGQIFYAPTGYAYPNPALGVMSKQHKLMLEAGAQIGFSPTARAALTRAGANSRSGPPGQIAQGSKLAAYLAAKPDRLD